MLLERVHSAAQQQGRTLNSIVEQALANLLFVPPAFPDLPEQPIELCARCEKGVLYASRCPVCGWHRYPRMYKRTRARDTTRRAAKARKLRLSA